MGCGEGEKKHEIGFLGPDYATYSSVTMGVIHT